MFGSLCLGLLLALPVVGQDAPEALRVLSWNVRHGRGMDGKVDIERAAAWIHERGADIVLLQEVDAGCARSGGVDQAAEIGRVTGLFHAFGKAMDHDGGAYGQAILSRFPLLETEIHRLPGEGEPRIVFSARVETPDGRKLTVATLHLAPESGRAQLAQAQVAAAALLDSADPVILGGDFNADSESETFRVFMQAPWAPVAKEGGGMTYPANEPAVEIDHIILRGLSAEGPAVVAEERFLSDHRPLEARVRAGK